MVFGMYPRREISLLWAPRLRVKIHFIYLFLQFPQNFDYVLDGTACIWSMDSGRCLLQYQGHKGSVNSIRFHPAKDLVMTASGDCSVHLWQAAISPEQMVNYF